MDFCRGLACLSLLWVSLVHADDEAFSQYEIPDPSDVLFYESFQGSLKDSRWIASENPEYTGDWKIETHSTHDRKIDIETGLVVQDAAQKHAISAKFAGPLSTDGVDAIVVQYEVRFAKALECGGAYIKVLQDTATFTPSTFNSDNGYIIMFGPDRCGETNKVHLIIRHQNPITKEFEEKHLKTPPTIKNNLDTHVYTVVIRKDDSFELFIDEVSERTGSLHTDFSPPFTPAEEIDDPEDTKPTDWVDEALMDDPEASKPDDWDEDAPPMIPDLSVEQPEGWNTDALQQIPDPSVAEPEDWDEEDDGVWEAPIVKNPACSVGCGQWVRPTVENPDYVGVWVHPQIDNPAYKGIWEPKKIANPAYFEAKTPFQDLANMGGIGIEIWTMQDGIEFDNVVIDYSLAAAQSISNQTWRQKSKAERPTPQSENMMEYVTNLYNDYPTAFIVSLFVGLLTISLGLYFCFCSGDESLPVDDEDFEGEVHRTDNAEELEADEEDEAEEEAAQEEVE